MKTRHEYKLAGGTAFPASEVLAPEWPSRSLFTGMSLLDYFAGQALVGVLASNENFVGALAPKAYAIAMEMLSAREEALQLLKENDTND